MKKIIYFFIIVATMITLNGCKNNGVRLQIIEEDIITNKTKVYEQYSVNEGDLISLHDKVFYECNTPNDIKIVSINDEYVTISREKLRYDSGNASKTYTEEVIENIKYNDSFKTSINEDNPLSGACLQAQYSYYLVFVK